MSPNVHIKMSVQSEHGLTDCPGDYSYLRRAAAEVVSGRRVLANSYIAAYAMPWSDRKR